MNQNESDIDKKQTLLQNEIVDKGFIPEDFQEFCEKIKGEGKYSNQSQESNIDSWTYEEIFDLVIQYQKEKKEISLPSSPGSGQFDFDFSAQTFEQKLDPLFDLPQNNQTPTNIFFQGDFIQKEDISDDVVEQIKSFETENALQLKYECKKLGQGVLSTAKQEIQIIISGYQTVAGKLLQSSYVVYNINTKHLGWNVKRRFSDFVWLKNTLLKIYPGIVVPTLVEKSLENRSQVLLDKRRMLMEYFLQELLKTPEFRNSKYFEDFLKSDDKQFKQCVKDSEKISRPFQFQNLINMSGYIRLRLDSNVRQQCTSFETLLNFQEPSYNKIKQILKQLEQEFQQVGKSLSDLGEQFIQLSKISEKYDFTNAYRSIGSQDIYKVLHSYVKVQSDEMINRAKHMNDQLANFFRFHQMNLNSFRDCFKVRNQIALDVEKRKEIRENTFADDIIYSFDKKIARSKEFIDTPSKVNADILREQYAYYNWKFEDEAIKFQNRKIKSYSSHFYDCSKNLTNIIYQVYYTKLKKTQNKIQMIGFDLDYVKQLDFQQKTKKLESLLVQY